MKKNILHTLLASVMLAATAGLMTACTANDDNPAPRGPHEALIKKKIVGKWKLSTINNLNQATNGKMVLTYNKDATLAVSISYFNKETNTYVWRNKQPGTYSIAGNEIKNYLNQSGLYDATPHYIEAISDESMAMSSIGGGQTVYTRVTADYSEDIIGLWEGVEMTGEETYGNAEARIAYLPDGTYRYYQKNDKGEWELKAGQEVSEYNVDGDWLATRWQETGGEMNYEWWDIDDISDGLMKWSALREREDGTRFTTTFTWRKVEAPAGAIAVDLGLPSGTKWANMNIGASKPEDYGLYFAWGETVGYTSDTSDGRKFEWESYKWYSGSSSGKLAKYCTKDTYGIVDNKAVLAPDDDAAYMNWGSSWRMPTTTEIRELLDNTTYEWTAINGVSGCKFMSKTNGNSIFLPAAGYRYGPNHSRQTLMLYGYYWSSSLNEWYQYEAFGLGFDSEHAGSGIDARYDGFTVRPVQ